MQILMTGGCGFIGSHLVERFFKEGHQIIIIDNLINERKNNVTIKHDFYRLDVVDPRCDEVFSIHNIDIIIHLAGGEEDGFLLGLMNLLALGKKHQVKKFLFAVPEIKGIEKPLTAVKEWGRSLDMKLVALYFSHVYGPRQGWKKNTIGALLKQLWQGDCLVMPGTAEQNANLIYVEDVADAIYRLAERDYARDELSIAASSDCSLQELAQQLTQLATVQGVEYESGKHMLFSQKEWDNTCCERELGWRMKYTLSQGLAKTYQWYQEYLSETKSQSPVKALDCRLYWRKCRPYLENVFLFAIIAACTVSSENRIATSTEIGLDYNYVYIATMGFLYGKSQSIPATIFSTILLFYSLLQHGSDFAAIMYQTQPLIHLATYLFIGVLSGYLTDNRERMISDLETELKKSNDRYVFLEQMHRENVTTKDRLYRQIINSDDSIGRVYKIIQKLDSIEIENIYTAASGMTAELMRTDQVAIYGVGKSDYYLRQKTTSTLALQKLPKSLKIEDFPYLKKLMLDKQVFINKMLVPGIPDMAAPVVHQGKVIAVIQLYQLSFEDLSLYQQNLLQIIARLIADALGKAYRYEAGIQDKKYITNTRILVAEEFLKIQQEMQKRWQQLGLKTEVILLKIGNDELDYLKINEALSSVIREEDFIGLKSDGQVYILLLDITQKSILEVQNRIKMVGLETLVMIGEDHG